MFVRDIIQATASAGDIAVPALLAMDRRKGVSRLRHAGILTSRRLTRQSLPAIGHYWGGRDHTTVLNSLRKAEDLLAEGDEVMRDHLEQILALLGVAELPGEGDIALSPPALLTVNLAEVAADIAALERRLAGLRLQYAQLQEQVR